MDGKRDFEEPVEAASPAFVEPARAVAVASKSAADARTVRADATWQASSFDLAQGLDVKVMQSKLSRDTLDRLFRG